MLYAALDIHKHTFQAAVLDSETGEFTENRFTSTREELAHWAMQWQGKLAAVALDFTFRFSQRTPSRRGLHLLPARRASRGHPSRPPQAEDPARPAATLTAANRIAPCCQRKD